MNSTMESTSGVVGSYVSGYPSSVDGLLLSRDCNGLTGIFFLPCCYIAPLSIISGAWCCKVRFGVLGVRSDGTKCCHLSSARFLLRKGWKKRACQSHQRKQHCQSSPGRLSWNDARMIKSNLGFGEGCEIMR
ncbi:unnamed protein product [Lactuca saligna]|uniref:Uncharacterized protein n=1 Tax=Lactuca saligna TaxID=75948 RepID=A0AA35ZES4_LACSI|nr:unnamed protein product [Lactuca saligna]